jgi:hypothetical protein
MISPIQELAGTGWRGQPLYRLYEELHGLGANLDYIDWLAELVRRADGIKQQQF